MFGQTNPFGQTNNASSPFGSPSIFGQTNNASNNPFAPKPFGSTTPFGSQPGTSLFGGTSTGVFGQPSTPMNSTTTFGASSSPAFGSSTPAFGASSTPSFGSSSSSFVGSSMFGQKPAFGSFGSTPTQPSPFGNSFQQSQPAFGSSMFGSSTPFGASSQPAFGATSSPAFGASSTPAFGATSSPAFGSTASPAFGSQGSAFGASNTSVFGSGGAFGASSTPTFGASSAPAFGASSTPAFGASSAPAFGASSTPAFGASSTPAFGASSTPSFNFGSTPAFGQSTSAFGSSPFGSSTTPFGAQSSPFGAQATTPAFGNTGFGQSAFGGQSGGSRVAAYTPTTEADGGSAQSAGKLESISAMPVYKDKSHEELRWEDYQLGDKGGPRPGGQSAGGIGFNTSAPQSNPFNPTPSFAQTSSNPFSTSTSSNPFAPKTSNFGGTGFATSSPAFGSSALSNPFGTASSTPSLFQTSTPANPFGSNSTPSLFNTTNSSAFGSSPSIFGSGPAQGTTSAFSGGFGNTQSTGLFQSGSSLGQAGSAFGQTTSAFGQNSAPSFNQSSIFNTPSTGFGGLFSSTPSMISSNPSGFGQMPSLSTPFQSAQPGQTTGSFGFNNFGQTQAAASSSGFGIGGTSSIFGQNNFGQPIATQTPAILQPVPITNPFGTLPAMPQMSIGRAGTAPSVQYGISSMPVVDKPAPIRISSLLTSRHLSQRRFRFPARKYHPKNDGLKVPFFSDDEERPSTPKADALFIPRENPRALVVRPTEQWPTRASAEKASPLKESSTTVHENGKVSEKTSGPPRNGFSAEDKGGNGNLAEDCIVKDNHKPNGVHDDHTVRKGDDSHTALTGHRAGVADIEAQLPKLRRSDYYTEPTIQELAAKERSDPGFCRRVKDFVVGRHGYGSIKFEGVTDVRRLDLESLVQFNNREVIVYMDDSKKPPVGQGLNKPAEVTLLNIKCFDKKTGKQYTEGPKVEKYSEMLKRKVEDQGATFVSYDPIKGKWRFRVEHFSKYSLVDEDECDNPIRQFGPKPAGI